MNEIFELFCGNTLKKVDQSINHEAKLSRKRRNHESLVQYFDYGTYSTMNQIH